MANRGNDAKRAKAPITPRDRVMATAEKPAQAKKRRIGPAPDTGPVTKARTRVQRPRRREPSRQSVLRVALGLGCAFSAVGWVLSPWSDAVPAWMDVGVTIGLVLIGPAVGEVLAGVEFFAPRKRRLSPTRRRVAGAG